MAFPKQAVVQMALLYTLIRTLNTVINRISPKVQIAAAYVNIVVALALVKRAADVALAIDLICQWTRGGRQSMI